MTDNSADLRRYKYNISSSGKAITVFGLWTIIRMIMSLRYGGESFGDFVGIQNVNDELTLMVASIIFIIICALILWLHIYIGTGAVRYAAGRKKKKGFLIVAIPYFALEIFSMYLIGERLSSGDVSDTDVASIIVEITLILALFDLIYSFFKYNYLIKKEKQV